MGFLLRSKKGDKMDNKEIEKYILDMPDEVLSSMSFSVPWQYSPTSDAEYEDPDGSTSGLYSLKKGDSKYTREKLQEECWDKFQKNPQVNTSVRNTVGRLTGMGFAVTSGHMEIQEVLDEIELDPRNRLYNFWPKYVGRTHIEGELFLCLTCHADGFIEVDFLDPSSVTGGGDDDTGIIFHPTKTVMPLLYNCRIGEREVQIPSIFIARYPDLLEIIKEHKDFSSKKQGFCKSRKRIFGSFGGFFRFIVSWDRSFITRRAISYLRTTIEWLNHYENLKKYEIDHKKSSGAYLWVFTFEDVRKFKEWLTLSDSDRRKTGVMRKKTPGSSLFLPPGMSLEAKSPDLPKISDEDTDIMHMAISGLGEPEDITTGQSKGTFASVKASRAPMSDRISDEIAYFERFLRYDFWGSIFFLKQRTAGFRKYFSVEECVDFVNQKEVYKKVKKIPEKLIDFSWPISEMIDYESRAKGLLGVKHGSLVESMGIPMDEISRRLGFADYHTQRLKFATIKKMYPDLPLTIDQEMMQEKQLASTENKNKSKEVKKDALSE